MSGGGHVSRLTALVCRQEWQNAITIATGRERTWGDHIQQNSKQSRERFPGSNSAPHSICVSSRLFELLHVVFGPIGSQGDVHCLGSLSTISHVLSYPSDCFTASFSLLQWSVTSPLGAQTLLLSLMVRTPMIHSPRKPRLPLVSHRPPVASKRPQGIKRNIL